VISPQVVRKPDGSVVCVLPPHDLRLPSGELWRPRPPTGKRCSKCKRHLPFSAFRPNLKMRSGWDSWCRGCHLEANRRWRAAHPEAARGRRRAEPIEVTCSECGESFLGRPDRVVCSRRCKDRRYARLHPDKLAEKKRRKYRRQKGQA